MYGTGTIELNRFSIRRQPKRRNGTTATSMFVFVFGFFFFRFFFSHFFFWRVKNPIRKISKYTTFCSLFFLFPSSYFSLFQISILNLLFLINPTFSLFSPFFYNLQFTIYKLNLFSIYSFLD